MSNPLQEMTLDQLRTRTSMKWRTHPPDVLPLWVAEMDVPLAEPIVAAVTAAVETGDTGYARREMYAEAMMHFADKRWAYRFEHEQTAIVPDVMLGIVEALKVVTRPGDPVVINSPVYPPFYQFIEHMGRRVVEVPLTPEHRLDLDALDRAFGELTKNDGAAAYLLCSPHNPTGTVHTPAELTRVAELADAHDVRVVVDEIHAPIVHPGADFRPYLTLPGTQRAISLMSASKAFNLAGLKAALAVAGHDAVKDLAQIPEEVSHGASHVAVIAHAAGYHGGGRWLDALLAGLDANCRLLGELLSTQLPEIGYQPPEGTYLAWLDCRGVGLGDDPAATFLEQGRVALNSGPTFGTGGAGFARINLATSPEILTEAVRRMATVV